MSEFFDSVRMLWGVFDYNPNHDPENGKFSSKNGSVESIDLDSPPTGFSENNDGEKTLDNNERKRYSEAIIGVKTHLGQEIKSINDHAFDRIAQRDFTPRQILDCLYEGVTFPGNTRDPRTAYQCNGIRVIVINETSDLLTVINVEEL